VTLPLTAGVIGWPVAHSKSPLIHRFWMEKLGIDGDYGRFPVHPETLGAAVRALPALGLRGVNVTVPHKSAVMAFLDKVDPAAKAVGAVNTVVVENSRLTGYNTDVAGVAGPVADVGLEGKTLALIGAGGAARAVLAVAKARGVGHVALHNRSAARAAALLAEFEIAGSVYPLDAPLPPAALLFNATSLGMTGQPPLDLDLIPLPADAVVFDAVYAPLDTPLLAAARARGLRTIDGLAMLIGQAATAFEHFYGAPAPRQFDGELKAKLTG
jgi:shikimate dehydrogenase